METEIAINNLSLQLQSENITQPFPSRFMEITEIPWSGPIFFEGQMTGDGRFFNVGSINWDEASLPWPFRWQKTAQPGHIDASVIGRVDRIYRLDSNPGIIFAEGVLLSGDKAPVESEQFLNLLQNRAAGGVSADGDSVDVEVIPVIDSNGEIVGREYFFNSMRLRTITAVDIPAFIGAKIRLEQTPDELLASGIPVKPPKEWFQRQKTEGPKAWTVTEQGQVFGYLALKDVCHIGLKGCVTVPLGNSYNYFHTGEIETEDGTKINVGHITIGTNHAGRNDNAFTAAAHYDHTGTVAADVCAGEDEYGVWVAGAMRPTLSEESIREFRAAPLSGDWRRIAGKLELVAVLGVNVPGFPVPRTQFLVASGEVESMISVAESPEAVEYVGNHLVGKVEEITLKFDRDNLIYKFNKLQESRK